jgi:hypothetical protein
MKNYINVYFATGFWVTWYIRVNHTFWESPSIILLSLTAYCAYGTCILCPLLTSACDLCTYCLDSRLLCSLHSTSSNTEYKVGDTFDWFLDYVTTLFNCLDCFAELHWWWEWRVAENVEWSSRDWLWVGSASQSAMTFSGHLPSTTVTLVAETSCVNEFQTVGNV